MHLWIQCTIFQSDPGVDEVNRAATWRGHGDTWLQPSAIRGVPEEAHSPESASPWKDHYSINPIPRAHDVSYSVMTTARASGDDSSGFSVSTITAISSVRVLVFAASIAAGWGP